MIQTFVKQLYQELDLKTPIVNDGGAFSLKLGDDVVITMSDLEQGFNLYCRIAPCAAQRREGLVAYAMHGNLFGQGTHGAVLGLSEDGNLLTLTKSVDWGADYREFRDTLEDFINIVDFWRAEATKK